MFINTRGRTRTKGEVQPSPMSPKLKFLGNKTGNRKNCPYNPGQNQNQTKLLYTQNKNKMKEA